MKMPHQPPSLQEITKELVSDPLRWSKLWLSSRNIGQDDYLHWDDLRFREPPDGMTLHEWWWMLKTGRKAASSAVSLCDSAGKSFTYCSTPFVQAQLHEIDFNAGGIATLREPIVNSQNRDSYLARSLAEEAITSSQLEGAATTRQIARDMIRSGRQPRDGHERMIFNNYRTMQRIIELKNQPLTPELVFEVHRLVTDGALKTKDGAGRFRRAEENIFVGPSDNDVWHVPPPAAQLPKRMKELCDFANGRTKGSFIHPVVRAIIVHFCLGHDHPFVDGNGRTARALFYWTMLNHGYWLFEYISISNILLKAPAQYARSFLLAETDEGDLTYFIMAQMKVIRRAIADLHSYMDRRISETRNLQERLKDFDFLNHRQIEILRHALKHPHQRYTINTHQRDHNVVYQTARTDMLDLVKRGFLVQSKLGKALVFTRAPDFESRIQG